MKHLAFASALALAFVALAFRAALLSFSPVIVAGLLVIAALILVLALLRMSPRWRVRSAFSLAAALTLAGCNTATPGATPAVSGAPLTPAQLLANFNGQVAADIPTACAAAASANAAFQTVAASGTIKPALVTTVNAWNAALTAVCNAPAGSVSPAQILQLAANAYVAFVQAKQGVQPAPPPAITIVMPAPAPTAVAAPAPVAAPVAAPAPAN